MILYAFMTILHTGRDAVSQQRVWAVGRAPGLVRSALCSAEASTGGRRHQQAVGGVREWVGAWQQASPTAQRELSVLSWLPGGATHQEEGPQVHSALVIFSPDLLHLN